MNGQALEIARGIDIPSRYDLFVSDWEGIHEEVESKGIMAGVYLAYELGFLKGHRATRRNRFKEPRRKGKNN